MHEPDVQHKYEMTDEQLTELMQTLRCPEGDVAPRPGFYAKVMDRIEAQQRSSIWSIFLEPVFSKRLAFASMAMILLLGVALFNANPQDDDDMATIGGGGAPVVFYSEDQPAPALGGQPDALRAQPVATMDAEQGRNVVLVDLVSYQEH
jgi:hypothetical protein